MSNDVVNKTVVFTVKSLIVSSIFLVTMVAGGVFAWTDLRGEIKATKDQTIVNTAQVISMGCDIKDLRNIVNAYIYKMPRPQLPRGCQ